MGGSVLSKGILVGRLPSFHISNHTLAPHAKVPGQKPDFLASSWCWSDTKPCRGAIYQQCGSLRPWDSESDSTRRIMQSDGPTAECSLLGIMVTWIVKVIQNLEVGTNHFNLFGSKFDSQWSMENQSVCSAYLHLSKLYIFFLQII